MSDNTFFDRKFSVGLCLSEPLPAIQAFLEKNQNWLNSVYFSLPLGMRFFSRESLVDEYRDNDGKLFAILDMLTGFGIRREMAINTWNLTDEELEQAVQYCREHGLQPEEIVCLREYGTAMRRAFPGAELKYSVNNPEADGSRINRVFHTLVAGKGLLRDMRARHCFLDRGYHITLLLNNGCIWTCNRPCEAIRCQGYFDHMIRSRGLDWTYARCSFFPSELRALILHDPQSSRYKYKISNRPLGLKYTQQVLDAYLSLSEDTEMMRNDYRNLALFCTVHPLAARMHDVNIDHVEALKKQWMMELEHDYHR